MIKRLEYTNHTVLITVKAYPNISSNVKLGETCCIGGIDPDGKWIRIYPILFRDLPYNQRPKKYDIANIDLAKKRDPRPESYFPKESTLRVLSHISTEDGTWAERKRWVLKGISESMCEIQRLSASENKSFGLFQPKEIVDFTVEDDDVQWTAKQAQVIKQGNLFGTGRTPLDKIPFKFRYHYYCEDAACKGHDQQIIDWEICELYRNLREQYAGDVEAIKRGIRQKFFDDLCGPRYDTHFFVGDQAFHLGSFMVLGLFRPLKRR